MQRTIIFPGRRCFYPSDHWSTNSIGAFFFLHLDSLVRTKVKVPGVDLLGRCDPGVEQTVGPTPRWRVGLSSLSNEQWCGLVDVSNQIIWFLHTIVER